jgi:hypothetical protein
VKTTVEIPDDLYRQAKSELAVLMKGARGVGDSGIPDLASNPKHLAGFGNDARRYG